MTYSLAVCARTACVDVIAVREVALCVKYGHFGAQTLPTSVQAKIRHDEYFSVRNLSIGFLREIAIT